MHLTDACQLRESAVTCSLCALIITAVLQYNTGQKFPRTSSASSHRQQELWDVTEFETHLIREPIYLRPKRDFLRRAFPEKSVPNAWHLRGFTAFIPVEGDILTGFVRLYAHSDSDAALSCDVIGRPALPSSDCPAAYSLIRRWIGTCIEDHEMCRETLAGVIIDETSAPILPTRIIDVGPPDGSINPRLVETQNKTSGFYASLSHCWGPANKRPLMTTRATLRDRMAGIAWDDIPKTYQDAIIAIRQINIRYLWIDSLCIIQDDHADWLKESKKMGLVYENACLTIAASHASDSSQGCFFERPRQKNQAVELPYINSTGDLAGSMFAISMQNNYAEISPEFGSLAIRAWATQEWLLSRRMIFYTKGSLVWSCKYITQRETGGSFHSTARNPKWKFIVEKYSARLLTNATDRLIALNGLSCEMQKKTKDTYCYGLWRNSLPDQLLWYCIVPAQRSLSRLNIPTWSWASTMHGICFLNIKKAKNVCKYIRFNKNNGTLTIGTRIKKAPKVTLPLSPNPAGFGEPDDDLTVVRYSTFMEEARNNLPVAMACAIYTNQTEVLGWGILDEGEGWTPSSDIYCLALMSRKGIPSSKIESSGGFKTSFRVSWQEDWVMLLQLSSSNANTFKRIGVGKIFWKSWFQDEPLRQVHVL